MEQQFLSCNDRISLTIRSQNGITKKIGQINLDKGQGTGNANMCSPVNDSPTNKYESGIENIKNVRGILVIIISNGS